jgi:hypothetical protein
MVFEQASGVYQYRPLYFFKQSNRLSRHLLKSVSTLLKQPNRFNSGTEKTIESGRKVTKKCYFLQLFWHFLLKFGKPLDFQQLGR